MSHHGTLWARLFADNLTDVFDQGLTFKLRLFSHNNARVWVGFRFSASFYGSIPSPDYAHLLPGRSTSDSAPGGRFVNLRSERG